MHVYRFELIGSSGMPPSYPEHDCPEVAVAGRSNVGKSSLLNTLVGCRDMARVSRTPGRTQRLNFFSIERRLVLVDLPGFGFAHVSRAMQAEWGRLMAHYFHGRSALKALLLLVDVRRDPEVEELDLLELCRQRGLPVVAVATKADKVAKNRRMPRLVAIASALGLPPAAVTAFSASSGEGRDALWHRVWRVAGLAAAPGSPAAEGVGAGSRATSGPGGRP